jgi:putative phage-type endonuclease
MKTTTYTDRDEWLAARKGKITGSRLADIIVKKAGGSRKIGFYELIAERISTDPEGLAFQETPMERGTRLEPEALARFVEVTGKKVDTSLVMWARDDNESIAISPDGFIGKLEAVETKCLSSAKHIKAYLTQQVPEDYEEQVTQYFIVNDQLRTLWLAFYDPRIPLLDFFFLEIKRADVQEDVEDYLEQQRAALIEVDKFVNILTKF